MKVTDKQVVFMHYTLKNEKGETLDSSQGREPMPYIHGLGHIIPGLEKQLEGKSKGDKVNAVVTPEEGYGTRKDELVQVVPKSGFQAEEGAPGLEVGMQVQVETGQGPAIAVVANIEGEDVTLDLNHPLADMTLHFDIEITDVRGATEEEIEHGHVHGPGGHQH